MLINWLYSIRSAVEEIYVIYSIAGHSYLPPDRNFEKLQKVVKRKEVIIDPKEYRAIFSEFATLLDMEKQKKGLVRGEANYRANMGVYKSVLKKGKSLANIIPELLPKKVPVNSLKLNDVDNRLKKHFGQDWRNVCGVGSTFYQRIIDNNDDNQLEAPDKDTTLPNMEEDGLRI
ncbi:unnamed protein product [Psylliodes chrysocephalus]|uniref:Uncharacterized protein n=1 Tax=Psylliodes chrysocephalus TaxID=3402493 RepID=A0A9P0DF34_9CUCU|nr:unnamed protein product [Psylliodes chrysocephala]